MELQSFKVFSLSDVSTIKLLSVDEWQAVRDNPSIPRFTSCWWLSTHGFRDGVGTSVYFDGDAYNYFDKAASDVGVRPAFEISGLNTEIGGKVFVNGTLCTVITSNTVLSDSVICTHMFDDQSNEYDNSDIKTFINSSAFKNLL